ncbi:DUF6527 family protein [Acidiferrimicrobium sp. IK]|uniref:DUF6527 family protein n=1 Tax=Acidiferrimicrobium sp. IK TaxID=2871700 RepID=UPI003966CFA4
MTGWRRSSRSSRGLRIEVGLLRIRDRGAHRCHHLRRCGRRPGEGRSRGSSHSCSRRAGRRFSRRRSSLKHWCASDGRHGTHLWLWCPGCDERDPGHAGAHAVEVAPAGPEPRWQWDGNLERPTLTPSILCLGLIRCHSFVRAGQWQFLADCEHSLAGRSVPLPPLPDWLLG